MEKKDLIDTEVGTRDNKKALAPAIVKVLEWEIKEGNEDISPIVEFLCLHPESDKPIRLSRIKFEKNKKIISTGLWVKKDTENKISKNSALGYFMKFNNCNVLNDFKGKELQTVRDDNEFLVFKTY